jgi:hypothetical protein
MAVHWVWLTDVRTAGRSALLRVVTPGERTVAHLVLSLRWDVNCQGVNYSGGSFRWDANCWAVIRFRLRDLPRQSAEPAPRQSLARTSATPRGHALQSASWNPICS